MSNEGVSVGTGTFGRVYLCQDRIDQQYLALKALKKIDIVRLKQVEHIRSEKDILGEICHPFIVTLYVKPSAQALLHEKNKL
jgi:protein kinase X